MAECFTRFKERRQTCLRVRRTYEVGYPAIQTEEQSVGYNKEAALRLDVGVETDRGAKKLKNPGEGRKESLGRRGGRNRKREKENSFFFFSSPLSLTTSALNFSFPPSLKGAFGFPWRKGELGERGGGGGDFARRPLKKK